VGFEPGACDGKDRNFVDERGHDATGNAVLEALKDYDVQTPTGPGTNYRVPRHTGGEGEPAGNPAFPALY
jgi:hypothetical protein